MSCHDVAAVDIAFDDPSLIADAGLVLVMALAERIGLLELIAGHVAITGAANSAGANPSVKVLLLLAGMTAVADSIEDMDRPQHAGCGNVFGGIPAPSTPGSFLRAFVHGHVRQLNMLLRKALVALAQRSPLLAGRARRCSWTWTLLTDRSTATPSRVSGAAPRPGAGGARARRRGQR